MSVELDSGPNSRQLPSVKQSSGSSRSSASSGIFRRISSGSGQSTVLPSEELLSLAPCRTQAQGSESSFLRLPGNLHCRPDLLRARRCRAGPAGGGGAGGSLPCLLPDQLRPRPVMLSE